MQNRYNRRNRRKYNLKVRIILVTKYRKALWLWIRYRNILTKQYWKKYIFWSDGYFACSIGEVSSTTIEKYIAEQG